jgi:hypothetical protein
VGFQQINPKVVAAEVAPGREVLARRGAMLAYTGDVGFAPVHAGPGGLGGMAGRMMAGEQVKMMAAEGTGTVYYGFKGLYVTIIEMDGSGPLSVEADRLVAHDAALQSTVVFLGQQGGLRGAVRGAVSGQGLFTTQLHGLRHRRGALPTAAPSRCRSGPGCPPPSTRSLRRPRRPGPGRRVTQRELARRGREGLGRGRPAEDVRHRHGLRAGLRAEDLRTP